MTKHLQKIAAATVFSVLTICALSGCGQKDSDAVSTLSPDSLKDAPYPLQTDETLSLWMRHNVGGKVEGIADYNEYPRVAEMQEKTGVTLEITYAEAGMEEDEFNMLLASEDLPDMIYYDWMNIPGGADKAIQDGYIAALNGLMTEYSPNLCRFLDENPDVAKMARTDSGNYYMYGQYREEPAEKTNQVPSGYVMRSDWLEAVGLPPPETMEEWHTVLTAFKEQLNVPSPLTYNFSDEYAWRGLAAAYGIDTGFYQQDGTVKYGPAQPEYRAYLSEMNRWYTEGLLDENIVTVSDEVASEKMISGESGASFAWLGAGMGNWISKGQTVDSDYDLVGLKPPTLEKGTLAAFANRNATVSHMGVAITAGSTKQELAAKFLDYGYSAEGIITYNYGIEGVSYEYRDGKPVYKEPEDGMSRSDFLSLYTFSSGNWVTVSLPNLYEFYYSLPQQKQALQAFQQLDDTDYSMPPITPTVDEAAETSQLEREIEYYVQDMRTKFILGIEPIQNFDAYLAKLEEMGLGRLLELKQAALDRYNRR